MSEDVNIGNPLNDRHDEEERNAAHVTPVPAQAEANDLFDDTVEPSPGEQAELEGERMRPNCRTEG
jgi:hypothetical protein